MEGDGYDMVFHCEFADADLWAFCEPDASPVYCGLSEVKEEDANT